MVPAKVSYRSAGSIPVRSTMKTREQVEAWTAEWIKTNTEHDWQAAVHDPTSHNHKRCKQEYDAIVEEAWRHQQALNNWTG